MLRIGMDKTAERLFSDFLEKKGETKLKRYIS